MRAYQSGWELEDNPNAARVRATVRLQGDELDPAHVTDALLIEPSFAAAKGELRPPGRSSKAPSVRQPTGVWLFTTADLASTSLERHLLAALDRIEPRAVELKELIDANHLAFDIVCYWVSATGQGGPGITPKTLGRVAAVGAILAFELQGPYDS